MIEMEETETPVVRKVVYRTPAPDGSNITAMIEADNVSIGYGGTTLALPVVALSALTALAATISAAIQPIVEEPADEEPVVPDPEPAE